LCDGFRTVVHEVLICAMVLEQWFLQIQYDMCAESDTNKPVLVVYLKCCDITNLKHYQKYPNGFTNSVNIYILLQRSLCTHLFR